MKRIKKPKGLTGVEGMVTSVIGQAVTDAMRGKPADKADALRYFRSETYKSHLLILDKPDHWLPDPE